MSQVRFYKGEWSVERRGTDPVIALKLFLSLSVISFLFGGARASIRNDDGRQLNIVLINL
jgi:hypothetical protein